MSSGKKWGNNSNYRKNNYNNQNFNYKPRYNSKTQDSKPTKKWEQKERDSKITLMHKSSHFIPAQFSDSFFRQFDLAMKLKKDELKKQGKVNAEVSEVTEENLIEAFGVTKDHMSKAAKILGKGENTENSGSSLA